jgi:hypothetical protein
MGTKWYLRDLTSVFGPTNEQTSYTSDGNAIGYDTPRQMTTTKGSAQVETSKTLLGAGYVYHRVFVSTSLSPMTIPAQTITVAVGSKKAIGSVSFAWGLYVWRNGANAATICANQIDGTVVAVAEEGRIDTDTSTQVILQAHDRICLEIWTYGSSAAGHYFYYDGTTDPEDSVGTADAASYISFGTSTISEYIASGLITIG